MSEALAQLLLVDDDQQLATMLQEFLQLQGFSVDVVHDGESALARVASSPPDLLVLDVMLPDINGFDVLRQLRQTHQRRRIRAHPGFDGWRR